MQVSTPRRTGSFEISCGLPTGKVVALPAALRALPRVRGPPRVCCARGPDPATGWERDRQSQPAPHDFTLAARELRLGQVGGTCGPTPTPICCDRGRGCPSWGRYRPQGAVSGRANPRGGTAWGPRGGARPRVSANSAARPARPPAPPLTEEALHDSQRVAEPILPTRHLARGRGRRGPGGGDPRAERGRAAGAQLLFGGSAAPRSRPPTHSERRGAGLPRLRERRLRWGCRGAAGDGQAGAYGPLAFTSHNGGKQPPPTALPATWVELARGGAAGARGAARLCGARRRGGPGRWRRRRHLGDGQKEGHAAPLEAAQRGPGVVFQGRRVVVCPHVSACSGSSHSGLRAQSESSHNS